MSLQIKMTYCEPPQIVWCKDEYGYPVRGRAPKSPTRPARAYEVETWWEDVTPEVALRELGRNGHREIHGILRESPARGF